MSRTLKLDDRLYQYLLDHSTPEHPVLAELRAATSGMKMAGMQIGADQGLFMQMLVRLIGAKRTLEIGVFTGYSSLSVALALPPDGKIIACDVSEEWTSMARKFWAKAGVEAKIDLRLAPALQTLDALVAEGRSGSFDFAFIDADKPAYAGYYERCLTLLRKGGLIAVDNTLWSGAVADPANNEESTVALRAFNDMLCKDKRIALSVLPVGDGVSLALKL